VQSVAQPSRRGYASEEGEEDQPGLRFLRDRWEGNRPRDQGDDGHPKESEVASDQPCRGARVEPGPEALAIAAARAPKRVHSNARVDG
jgi:hypothetical protein